MISFRVKSSSSDEIYRLAAGVEDGAFRFLCSCPAGQYGGSCKHRLGLISGSAKNLVDGTQGDIAKLQAMVAGTEIPLILKELSALEKKAASIKAQISVMKSELADALGG